MDPIEHGDIPAIAMLVKPRGYTTPWSQDASEKLGGLGCGPMANTRAPPNEGHVTNLQGNGPFQDGPTKTQTYKWGYK